VKLPKPIAEIASTFMKDGMNLDDAVLAAFRIMDEAPTPAVQKVLARDKKFNAELGPSRGSMETYIRPRDVKSLGGFLQKDINNTLTGLPLPGASPREAAALRRSAMANIDTPLNDGTMGLIEDLTAGSDFPPEVLADELIANRYVAERLRKVAARRYAMEQLGLTDNGIL